MEENTGDKTQPTEDITLSAALLAPLNSIFEAQIHAARAFLNFILQMGFRHQYSDKEIKALENNSKNAEILKEINAQKDAKEKIKKLEEKKKSESKLSSAEMEELEGLKLNWDDLYYQRFDLLDGDGQNSKVFIPNLALLPIKPLAVDNANFKFNLQVKSYSSEYEQMGSAFGADKKRPWYLINPKSIRGEYSKGESNEKKIEVEIHVSATEIPYGLDKLLVSLTNNVAVTKSDIPKIP